MTEKIYRTKTYSANHSIYGGKIDIEDFNTNSPSKKRIGNQIDANNLQLEIIKRENKRKEEQKYKHMTLEKLKEMKIVSNTNGRPSPTLTDKKWQKEFQIRKMFITPYAKGITKLKGSYYQESGTWNNETQSIYNGYTNWQSYCAYINDVLNNIRSGQIDYCYYIYQIIDLAKFHYHNLKTKYLDGYWEVWLEK